MFISYLYSKPNNKLFNFILFIHKKSESSVLVNSRSKWWKLKKEKKMARAEKLNGGGQTRPSYVANSLNDHNGSADVDTQLGSHRFSRFVTKSTHFPHSQWPSLIPSLSLSLSIFLSEKSPYTFFPRKYHFPRKQTVRYSLLSSYLHFAFEALDSLFFTVSRLFNWWFSLCFFPGKCWFFFSRENGQEVPSILVSHRTCLLRKSWFTGSGFYGSTRW